MEALKLQFKNVISSKKNTRIIGVKKTRLDILTLTGKGIFRRKSRVKAKAESKSIKREMAINPQPTIPQTMPPTGLQPQQYRQQLTATTITPQMTQQLAQQVAEQIKQQLHLV